MPTTVKNYAWMACNLLLLLIDNVAYVLISFLLWQKNSSLQLIIKFNAIIFITILAATLLAGYLGSRLGAKRVLLLGFLAKLLISFYAFSYADSLADHLLIISVLIGLASALVSSGVNVMTQIVVPLDKQVRFFSSKEILASLISLIIPLAVKLGIDNVGYQSSFSYTMTGFALISVLLLLIPVAKIKEEFAAPQLIVSALRDPDIGNLAKINFSLGLSYAFGWGLMNIIILATLGSLNSWTTMSLVLAGVGIVIAGLLKGINLKERPKAKFVMLLGALIYAFTALLLITDFSITIFVVFSLAKLLFDKITSILTYSYMTSVESKDPYFEQRKTSYQLFGDFFTALGRLTPIIVLLLVPQELLTINLLLLILALSTLMPALFGNAFQKEYAGVF